MFRNTIMTILDRRWFAAVLILSGALHGPRAFAVDLDAQMRFNIPAQTLSSALVEFGRQTSIQIMTASSDLEGLQAVAVQGKMPIKAALSRLLTGTQLRFEAAGDNSVAVGKFTAEQSSTTGNAATPIRLAQTDELSPSQGEGQGEDRTTNTENGGTAEGEEDSESARKGIPEMLVRGKKGARSLNADIQRTKDDIQPYVVLDRKTIERSAAKDLNDLLRSSLTMNYVQLANEQLLPGLGGGSSSSVSLRGLSSGQTLILIDGRRAGLRGINGTTAQYDLNGIPLNAIERVEVLPTTASGIYGGSATAGVINIGNYSPGYSNTQCLTM